jgi:glycerol uptake facilitator protein
MLRSPMLGEFMGTLILILLGNGVVAGVLLKRSKAENGGWLVITTAWAFAVLCGIFTANLFGSSDAHLNPAITLAAAINSGDFSRLLPYAAAQLAGAFAGAVLVYLFYHPHWAITPDAVAKRACFCTEPAIRSYPSNLFSEFLATFVLVLVAGAMGSKLVMSAGAASGLGPFLVSCIVWGVGLSLGGTTGYAINPVRDLGPRIAHTFLPIPAKTSSDWAYAWVPVVGPFLGGACAGLLLHLLGA